MSIESRSNQYGTVFEHWQIQELLGQGSGGKTAVFLLNRNDSFRASCALKVINLIEERGRYDDLPDYRKKEYKAALEDCKEKAIPEVQMMHDLCGHTNVVDYLDHKFHNWSDSSGFGCDLLIRMELLTDLRSIIRKGKFFGEDEILKVGRDICTALVLCHDNGILHRDIKPENIFVNQKGNYKLGDFGVSRLLGGSPSSMATTGIGTPEYAAPEQFTGRHDKRVDIYSLGLVLYELCNQNKLPFASSCYVRQEEIVKRQSGVPFPKPNGISSGLWSVLQKACSFKATDRYATAQEFLEALCRLDGTVLPKTTASVGKQQRSYQTMKASVPHTDYSTQPALSSSNDQGGYSTVLADRVEALKNKPKKKGMAGKLIAILLALLLLVGGGIVSYNHFHNIAVEKKAIATIIDEATMLADADNYDSAIMKVREGLDEYPNSDKLEEKLNELIALQTDFEVAAIISEAEVLASSTDYEGAITKIEVGLSEYPESSSLQDKVAEYADALSAKVKSDTLAEAKALANAGEYESAMSLIKAAQEAYGTCKEYDDAYASYHKAYSLAEAKVYVDSGDYASAIKLLSEAQKVNTNDVELIAAYNSYSDSYTQIVVANADALFAERKMDEALAEVDAGLQILSDSKVLKDKKAELVASKPISITTLNEINNEYWSWNEYDATDTYGNNYADKCNYFTGTNFNKKSIEYRPNKEYGLLTGIAAPSNGLRDDVNVTLRIYADDKLVYTSPIVNRKTEAFRFEVDLTDVEFVKIEVDADFTLSTCFCLIVADVQLWP